MRLISHRGNIEGRDPQLENTYRAINTALAKGFDVEVDVWKINDQYFLGHDRPDKKVHIDWFLERSESLWIHAKNLAALRTMWSVSHFNVFWQENDKFSMTSKGFIWTNVGEPTTNKSVLVALNREDLVGLTSGTYAICSDYVNYLK